MVAKTRSAHASSGVGVGVAVGVGVSEGRGERAAEGPQAEPATTINKRTAPSRERSIAEVTPRGSVGLLRVMPAPSWVRWDRSTARDEGQAPCAGGLGEREENAR